MEGQRMTFSSTPWAAHDCMARALSWSARSLNNQLRCKARKTSRNPAWVRFAHPMGHRVARSMWLLTHTALATAYGGLTSVLSGWKDSMNVESPPPAHEPNGSLHKSLIHGGITPKPPLYELAPLKRRFSPFKLHKWGMTPKPPSDHYANLIGHWTHGVRSCCVCEL